MNSPPSSITTIPPDPLLPAPPLEKTDKTSPKLEPSTPPPIAARQALTLNIESESGSKPIIRDIHNIRDTHQDRNQVEEAMHSPEATPSSPSAASSPQSQLESTSGSATGSFSQTLSAGSGSHEEDVDVDRFLKRMEMEKKMHALQQRLELASMKATNGWTDMTMNEIENKLPTTPLRSRKAELSLLPASPIGAPTPTSSVPYEPPSPSRPWQLIDVLWQPLPPPSHGRYPTSPSSPRKRSRTDEHPEPPRPQVNGYGFPPTQHRSYPSPKQSAGQHRRSSSSMSGGQVYDRHSFASPSSPLRPQFEDGKKKRSQSHSTHRRARKDQPTTSQDVDAAKALTFMLGSGASDDGSMSRRNSQLSAPLLPPLGSQSLPIPDTYERSSASLSPTARPRALSQQSTTTPRPVDLRTPNSHARSRVPPDSGSSNSEMDRGEEDKTAAELMMFLAHSPSPMKSVGASASRGTSGNPFPNGDSASPTAPTFGTAARVLFADDPDIKAAAGLPTLTSTRLPSRSSHSHTQSTSFAPSNLAVAPPSTPK